MNKRQKKKLYKKQHGSNPPKIADVQRNVQPKIPAPKQQRPFMETQIAENAQTRRKNAAHYMTVTAH